MRKFLYLRTVAIISVVILLAYMAFITYFWLRRISWNNWYMWVLSEAFVVLLVSHSVVVLFIYHKYYPNKEINKPAMLCYRLSEVFGWLLIGFCLLGVIFSFIAEQTQSTDVFLSGKKGNIALHLLGLMAIAAYVSQLLGGGRMIKTIRRNARAQLENSFT